MCPYRVLIISFLVFDIGVFLTSNETESCAGILFVAQDGSGTDGVTWDSAFTSIGAALTASASGDCIWVKTGVYNENLELPDHEISIRGGFIGTEKSPDERDLGVHPTIVGDTTYDGRTIRHFRSDLNRESWQVLIEDLILKAGQAGCFEFLEGITRKLHIIIRRCQCDYNAEGKSGNSLNVIGVDTLFIDSCNFSQWGFSELGTFDEQNVIYLGCYDATIQNSVFTQASIGKASGVSSAGTVLHIPWSTAETFFRRVTLINVTVYRSDLGSDIRAVRGISYPFSVPPIVKCENTILVGGRSGITEELTYCNVFDASATEGVGNISVDPLFVNPAEGDFRLQSNSPCIDSGTVVAQAEDIEGNPRPVDIPGVGHSGPAAFDMGAYELQKNDDTLHGDLNGDGAVNQLDLFLFQKEWMEANSQEEKRRFE